MHTTKQDASRFIPLNHSLDGLREAIQECRGCDLYRRATQAVLGEIEGALEQGSSESIEIMMIGEQPGDREDIEGRPFVGPAGKLLDRCLQEAGIDRKAVYITNTVKHFKWEPKGKIRLHKKPSITEIHACRPWLDAELDAVQPRLIVCLGAVAAQSLPGCEIQSDSQPWHSAEGGRVSTDSRNCSSRFNFASSHRGRQTQADGSVY